MSNYADPAQCPDCRARIEYGAVACATCGLPLRGQVAQELYVTLMRADQLVAQLRASLAPAVAVAAPSPVAAAPRPGPAGPAAPARPATPQPSMSATSVPKILLTLGATCLLVAALVFLAVTWSVMGVGGRTATLVGFTVICAALTALVARRGLRGATEALGLVSLGLLALDVTGADNAGWLGDLEPSRFAIILGLILAAAATAACLALRRTPSDAFTSGEVVAGLAVFTIDLGLVTGDWGSQGGRFFTAVLCAALGTFGLERLSLRIGSSSAAVVAVLAWIGLGLAGFSQVAIDPTLAHLWGADLGAWPAVAAAVLAGSLAVVRRLQLALRMAGVAMGLMIVSLVAIAPALDEGSTEAGLAFVAVVVAATAMLSVVRKPWGGTAILALAVSALPTAAAAVVLLGTAVDRLLDSARSPGRFLDVLPAHNSPDAEPWLLLVCAAALAVAAAALFRYAGRTAPWLRVTSYVSLLAAVGTAANYTLPVWIFVAVGLTAGAAFVLTRDLLAGGVTLAATVAVSLHSDGLTAIALGAVVAAAAWLLVGDERTEVRYAAGVVGQLALAASVWTWGDLLDEPGQWVAAAGIVVLAGVAVAIREPGLEIGAAVSVAALLVPGALAAPADDTWTWVAVYLTVSGVAACVQSLLRADRRELAWVGGLLLAMATWVRLADIGVHDPEPYTLPSAVALLVVGLVHLRRNPGSSTVTALSPGLALALTPSLLWALAEPGTARSVLLGLACLALVVAGVQLRWTAPLAYAAAAGSLLVVRHAAPYIEAGVPRWVLIGSAGVLLVAMGVTWEQRVREAKLVLGYVRGLR